VRGFYFAGMGFCGDGLISLLYFALFSAFYRNPSEINY